jgi:hypothetical protein
MSFFALDLSDSPIWLVLNGTLCDHGPPPRVWGKLPPIPNHASRVRSAYSPLSGKGFRTSSPRGTRKQNQKRRAPAIASTVPMRNKGR